MVYNVEREFTTSFYRCIDPIENFKIKVILEPIRNSSIPLPQFDKNKSSASHIESIEKFDEAREEYIFEWQEKLFNKNEIKKYLNDIDLKKNFSEKYFKNFEIAVKKQQQLPKKLFSYIDIDYYSLNDNKYKKSFAPQNRNSLNFSGQQKNSLINIPKTKIINYYPSKEFKNQTHSLHINIQKMFLMVDLGSQSKEEEKLEKSEKNNYFVLCAISYNHATKLLEIVPSFSQNPYIINYENEDKIPAFYYWLQNASSDIPKEILNKENKIIAKVFEHQEEIKNLQIGTKFFIGKPNFLYVTLLGEIVSAEDFEYDFLHIYYNVKLPHGWEKSNNNNSLFGVTHTSSQNSQGIIYFSYLFEVNFFVNSESFNDSFLSFPQIFFEVIALDKYMRYRHEGYTYISVPDNPGMYNYKLQCWRATDNTIKSKLKRFFIGGGPELEDINYVGLTNPENAELINRYGFVTSPSGKINLKLSVIHQCDTLKSKKFGQHIMEKNINERIKADSLLSSVNSVLEAFRQARARMIEVKKKLEIDNYNNDTFHT